MSNDQVSINLSATQEGRLGKFLFRMYYGSGEESRLLELAPRAIGYGHNGGEHTLTVSGSRKDLAAWLTLFEEAAGVDLTKLHKELQTKGRVHGYKLMPELFRPVG